MTRILRLAIAGIFLALSPGCTTRDDITAELLRSTDDVGVPITTVPANELEVALAKVKMQRTFQSYTELGLAYLHKNDPGSALPAFLHANELSPRSAIGLNNLCVTYNYLARWDEGVAACEKSLAEQPDFRMAKNNLGWAQDGRRRAALPRDPMAAKLEAGMARYTAKDYRRAIEIWEGIDPASSAWPTAQSNIGSAAILMKDFKTAKKAIANALSREPANDRFRANEAWLRTEMASAKPR